MKDYEELLTSCHAMLQSLDKYPEWTNGIIEEVIKSSPNHQEVWLDYFTTMIKCLIQQYPEIRNHQWFTNNPIDLAQDYIKFENEQLDDENK